MSACLACEYTTVAVPPADVRWVTARASGASSTAVIAACGPGLVQLALGVQQHRRQDNDDDQARGHDAPGEPRHGPHGCRGLAGSAALGQPLRCSPGEPAWSTTGGSCLVRAARGEHPLAHLRRRRLRGGETQPGRGRRHPADLVGALLAASQVVLEPAPLGIVVDRVERVDTRQDMQVGRSSRITSPPCSPAA